MGMTSVLGAIAAGAAYRNNPSTVIKGMLKMENTPMSEEELDQFCKELFKDPRRSAYAAKLTQASDVVPSRPSAFDTMRIEIEQYIEDFNLEEIKVPTLIAHGTFDGDVDISQAKQASERIPGAKLFTQEGAHHLMGLHPKSKEMFDA